MKRTVAILSLVLFAIVPVWGKERAPLAAIMPALEAYVDQSMKAEGIPGVMVIVVKDGKIVYSKGFGEKIIGQRDPVDEHTPFALASVTKTFTNTLIARLVDKGVLQWTDKVTKYLPDFQLGDPKTSQEMTIEDLLSQRSGMVEYSGDTLIELGWSGPEIYSILKNFPMGGEFRKTYGYQNVLVGLMGKIMEKATGTPLSQLYQKELFEPIGLTETRIGERHSPNLWNKFLNLFKKTEPQPNFHIMYEDDTRYLPKGNPGLFTFPASSGIISTGKDLAQWMIFQLNKGVVNGKVIVSEANLNKMRTPHVDMGSMARQFPKERVTTIQYGMGWIIHDYAGVPMLSHMGGMAGTRSFLLIIPQDNLGIVVLANVGGMRATLFPEAIRNKFLDLYLNVKDEKDWAKILREEQKNYHVKYLSHRKLEMLQNLAPSRNLDDYVGIYENSLYGRVEIKNTENALTLIYKDRPNLRLKHWNGNVFDFNGADFSSGFSGVDFGEVIFSNENGKSNRLMISLLYEGQDSIFTRVK